MAEKDLEGAEVLFQAANMAGGAEANVRRQARDSAEERVRELRRQVSELTVTAPNAGTLVAPDIDQSLGRYLKTGQVVGEVRTDDRLEIFVSVDQGAFQRILGDADPLVQVRLASDLYVVHEALDVEGDELDEIQFLPKAKNDIRSAAMTFAGGGSLAPDPSDPNKSAAEVFELRVVLDNPGLNGKQPYVPGQRAYIRVKLDNEPLALQWWRKFLQLIQTQRTVRSVNPQ